MAAARPTNMVRPRTTTLFVNGSRLINQALPSNRSEPLQSYREARTANRCPSCNTKKENPTNLLHSCAYNDSAHKLHALTLQLQEVFGHLSPRSALISTVPAAHVSLHARVRRTPFTVSEPPLGTQTAAIGSHPVQTQLPVLTLSPASDPNSQGDLHSPPFGSIPVRGSLPPTLAAARPTKMVRPRTTTLFVNGSRLINQALPSNRSELHCSRTEKLAPTTDAHPAIQKKKTLPISYTRVRI